MSVRVNLLPSEVKKRGEASRQMAMVGVGFVVLLVLIGAAYLWQAQRVSTARDARDEQQATVDALAADLADLNEFDELQARRQRSDQILQAAMGSEASSAGVMQDIAAVMPSDAELQSLNITFTPQTPPELGDLRSSYGSVTMSGRTRYGHAPGLERFLIEFDKVAAFSDVFFSNSTIDENGVSTFSVQIDLGPEVRTGRYAAGLPEEMQ